MRTRETHSIRVHGVYIHYHYKHAEPKLQFPAEVDIISITPTSENVQLLKLFEDFNGLADLEKYIIENHIED